MTLNIKDKFVACIMLHALGDTIGFKNGEWEFSTGTIDKRIFETLYEYFEFGGINYIPDGTWKVSDDTILNIDVIYSLLKNHAENNVEIFCDALVEQFIKSYDFFSIEKNMKEREPGSNTLKYMNILKEGTKWKNIPYDSYAGGSGASMRSSVIGLAFRGTNNRNKLLEWSIESSAITHNNAVGYLGGLTAALFTAYALEGIDIKMWPMLLLDMFNVGIIDKYIISKNRNVEEYVDDSETFINKWLVYVEDKFKDGEIIQRRSNRNLIHRAKYYFQFFGFEKERDTFFPGSGGDDSVIIAYDALIDCNGSWEKLIIYSVMHGGDSDTTACIASSWYGALYGFGDVPIHRIDKLESKYRDELYDLSEKMFDKYGK